MFKLKKGIALFLCVVMLSSVILTGCDNENPPPADTTQSTDSNQTTENVKATENVKTTEKVEITEDKKPAGDEKPAEGEGNTGGEETDGGYSVEESEWASLFTGTNLTLYTVTSQTDQTLKYDGDKIHNYTIYPNYNQIIDALFEFVLEGDSKICYVYEQVGAEGNWIKELDEYTRGERMIDSLYMYFYLFADKYNSFEYDAEDKLYTAESITVTYMGTTFVFTDICIKLEGGKLYEITYSANDAKLKINNVGTTSVTIPTLT